MGGVRVVKIGGAIRLTHGVLLDLKYTQYTQYTQQQYTLAQNQGVLLDLKHKQYTEYTHTNYIHLLKTRVYYWTGQNINTAAHLLSVSLGFKYTKQQYTLAEKPECICVFLDLKYTEQ